jgi:hypothetical protein
VPLMFLLIAAFFAVSGAARQLGGDIWGTTGEAVHGGDSVMLQHLRQMYPAAAGGGALVRHPQRKRWLPTVTTRSSERCCGACRNLQVLTISKFRCHDP